MKRAFRFNKNAKAEWFAVLPEWKGDIEDLQMVEGADLLLNMVANGKPFCTLEMADEAFDGAEVLTLVHVRDPGLSGGGDYLLESFNGKPAGLRIWLCAVTEFVFKGLPEKIWFCISPES